ncbi:MAG: hypothetical protein IRY85_21080 [Micromonosporaceae bacterium]|nr:hypothetical protein [Micromonosporaceae bacterium]
MTEPESAGGRGCLLGLGAVIGLGVLAAVIGFALLGGGDDVDTAASPGPTDTPSSVTSATGCADVTEDFRRFAGARLDVVRRVCWEADGRLRAEIELAADINASSAPAQALCAALTDFITASSRAWSGFTAYSLSPLTPGQPMLSREELDGPCRNPFQQ